jgi:SAM-dependent methyltransferase
MTFDPAMFDAALAAATAENPYFKIAGPRLRRCAQLVAELFPANLVPAMLDVGGFKQCSIVLAAGFPDTPGLAWQHINAETRLPGGFFDARSIPLPYADASLDLIVCWETIEHLFDVRKDGSVSFDGNLYALKEMRRVLKPDGALHLTTTNRFCPRTWASFRQGKAPMINAPTLDHPGHIREFNYQELAQLLVLAGFDVTSMTSFNAYNMHFTEAVADSLAPRMAHWLGRGLHEAEKYDTLLAFGTPSPQG